LLNLENKIKISLILSSSLKQIAPLMKIENLDKIPQQVEEAVSKLNDKAYGKLEYSFIDPSIDSTKSDELKKYDIMSLQWPAMPQNNILAGSGSIGLLMMYEESVVTIPLMKVQRIPIIGTQYQLTDMARIEDAIEGHLESLIDINEDIGVLADFGSVAVSASPPPNMGLQQIPDAASNLHSLISQNYTVKNIKLKEDTIPDSLNCFIIPGPKEPMTDYDLFQIDQFLMKGNSLAIFIDMYNEVFPGNQQGMQMMGQQGPMYIPVNSGLEKMLEHYGVRVSQSYVMDKNSFKQRMPAQFGGGERSVYFAPMIKKQNINNDPDFMRTIKGLVAVKTSPLSLVDERLVADGINATRLLSTSDKSWEMKGRINLNPMFIQPPESPDEMQSYPIAYLLEGKFTSYFSGKSIPEKQIEKEAENDKQSDSENTANNPEKESDSEKIDTSKIESDHEIIEKGEPGKIFVIASSEMIKDNILDKDGRSPNDMLILNLLDYLNNREGIAIMRSKEQRFNPLDEVSAGVRTFVKSFNIIGLPILIVILGLLVLFRRHARKRQIKMMFQ